MKRLFSLKNNEISSFWKCDNSSKAASVWTHDFYPGTVLDEIELQATFTPAGPGFLTLRISPYYVCLDDRHHQSYISRTVHGNILKHTDKLVLRRGKANQVRLHYAAGKVSVLLNGEKLVFTSRYRPTVDQIRITWPEGTAVDRLAVKGTESSFPVRPPKAKDFAWHITVDFPDDIAPAPFTRAMLANMMKTLAAMGYRRVYWIYYGGRTSGFWDDLDLFLSGPNVEKTFRQIGGDDLKAAVEAGHRAGLQVYAIIKPFDLTIMGRTFPPGSDWAAKYGKYDILGGKTYFSFHFPGHHPELCLKRRTMPTARPPIERITVTARDQALTLPWEINIWVSRDNYKYNRYVKPFTIARRPGKAVIKGLKIKEKFLAVEVPEAKDRNEIANTLSNLIRVHDPEGKEIAFTYGLQPRRFTRNQKGKGHLTGGINFGGDFREYGFFFDYLTAGIPSGVFCGDKCRNEIVALDNEHGVWESPSARMNSPPVFFARPNPGQGNSGWAWSGRPWPAAWTGSIFESRTMPISWSGRNTGSTGPWSMNSEKRNGVDVRTEAFNWEDWRRRRGEFYTRFLEQAKMAVRARGKRLQLHVEDMMEGAPTDRP